MHTLEDEEFELCIEESMERQTKPKDYRHAIRCSPLTGLALGLYQVVPDVECGCDQPNKACAVSKPGYQPSLIITWYWNPSPRDLMEVKGLSCPA